MEATTVIKTTRLPAQTSPAVRRESGFFRLEGKELERRVAMTDLNNDEAVRGLQGYFRRRNVDRLLRDAGVRDGDTVKVRDYEFEYRD